MERQLDPTKSVRKQLRRFLESEPLPIPVRKSTLDQVEKIIKKSEKKS